jgi:hypothetical protein
MPDYAKLVRASMQLRAMAPEAWDEFVKAMREQAATATGEILRVPPEMLSKAQGMAIMAHELSSVLNDAPRLYDKMQEAGRKHGQAS